MLDESLLRLAKSFLRQHPPPGETLLCGLTGSHIYGFPSGDSDLDLKAIHLAPTRAFLGLDKVPRGVERLEVFEGVECDYTSNEAGPALALMLRGNGNMLERIFSPCQLQPSPWLAELQELARDSLSRRCYDHYSGFFRGICRDHARAPVPRVKRLLYAYRVALTGLHLLKTRELQTRLDLLAPEYGFDEAVELIEAKRAGDEMLAIAPSDDVRHRANWQRLEELLAEAREQSPLPDVPANTAACSSWLVRQRLRILAD